MLRAIVLIVAGIAVAFSTNSLPIRAQMTDLVPHRDDQPSFDCAAAKTAAARLICADAELTRLDRELGAAFQKQTLQISPFDRSRFIVEELSWIKDRNARCGLVGKKDSTVDALASSKSCLVSAIRERIAFLLESAGPVDERPHPDGNATQTPPKRERTFDEGKIAALLNKLDTDRANTETQASPSLASDQAQLQTDPRRQVCIEPTNPATCGPIQSQQEKQRTAIAGKFELKKQLGYHPVSFEDFKLDGKTLAQANAKVILRGFYSKSGDVEILQPTGLAVATAKQYGNDGGIPVLSDDAARNVRKYFLECGNNPLAQLGCPITVSGHADLCTASSLLGSKSVPCLVVEDGW